MPDAKTRRQIAAARKGTFGGGIEPEAKPNRLDDPKVQEEIQNPKPLSMTIAGEEYILHPLSAKHARRFEGLYRQVLIETVAGQSEVRGAFPLSSRAAGIVAERYDDRFLPFLAYATGEPGQVDDAQAAALVAKFDESITAKEMGTAFVLIAGQNIHQGTGEKN